MRSRMLVTLLSVFLTLLAAGCASASAPSAPAASGSGVQELTVTTLDTFRFTPATLTVKAGQPVKITVQNQGKLEHDLTIAGMPATSVKNDTGGGHGHGVDPHMVMGHAPPGGEATVTFTPTEKGTYGFSCSLPGHKEAGMQGTLTVG